MVDEPRCEDSERHRELHDAAVRSAVEAQARGNFGLALALFQDALGHAEALDSRRKVHLARFNISSCYLSLGDWANARVGLPAIILESDDPRHVSGAAVNLAEALMKEGRLEKASHYLRIAVENARDAGDQSRELSALVMQGHLAVMDGQHASAVEHYQAALAHHRALGGAAGSDLAALLDNLGYGQLLAGQLAAGLATLRNALREAQRRHNERMEAEIRVDLAFGFLLGDKNENAERHALTGVALATQTRHAVALKSGTYILMELALRQRRGAQFEEYFAKLQALLPDVKLSRSFFRIFDISDMINLKEF